MARSDESSVRMPSKRSASVVHPFLELSPRYALFTSFTNAGISVAVATEIVIDSNMLQISVLLLKQIRIFKFMEDDFTHFSQFFKQLTWYCNVLLPAQNIHHKNICYARV